MADASASSMLPPPGAQVDPDDFYEMQRQGLLAQMAISGSQANDTPQNYGRMASRTSILSPIAKMAQAYMGRKALSAQSASATRLAQAMSQAGSSDLSTAASGVLPSPAGASMPPTDAGSGGGAPSAPQSQATFAQRMQALNHAAQLGRVDPEVIKATAAQIAAESKPSDLDPTLRGAGILPGTPLYQAVMTQAAQKANYIAPVESRAGNYTIDPITHKPIFQAPVVPTGSTASFDANGKPTAITAIPGAEEAARAAAAGTAAGTEGEHYVEIGTDASGRKLYSKASAAAPGVGTPQGSQPAAAAPSGAPGAQTPGRDYGLHLGSPASEGVLQSQKTGAEQGQAYAGELAKNATGSTEVRRSLSELRNLAAQSPPSAANPAKLQLGNLMIAAGADAGNVAQWLHADPSALSAAAKQTSGLAVSSIHSMTSRGTNFDLDTFMRNNPNLNMTDIDAFNRVADYMDNKASQEIAKQKDFVSWRRQPENADHPENWESDHTAHWLDKQNADIDAGKSRTRPPLSSFVRPQ